MHGGYFFAFSLFSPPPSPSMHFCMMNQNPSPPSRMSGHTVGTVSLLPNQQSRSAPTPWAKPALYPGGSAAEAGPSCVCTPLAIGWWLCTLARVISHIFEIAIGAF